MAADNSIGIKISTLIKDNYVNVYRSNDASTDDIIGAADKGYIIVATKLSPDKKYYYIPYYGGWIDVSDTEIVSPYLPDDVDEMKIIDKVTTEKTVTDFGSEPVVETDEYKLSTSRGLDLSGTVLSTKGIFAIPYQFSPMVDRRLGEGDYDDVGRKYAEKIMARNNLLFLTPGKQDFMPGADASEKAAVIEALQGGGDVNNINYYGRYYSLAFALDEYYNYVDPMCQSVARLLELNKVKLDGYGNTTIGNFHWAKYLNSKYGTYVGAANNILFYVDSFNEASEDFGNDTRESSLVSTVNGLSDTVKEINYVMGYREGEGIISGIADSKVYEGARSTITGVINNFSGGKGVLQALLGNSTTILAGGKLVFPELWSDSSFDRSYNINIKLRSPDSDPLSIYLNIIVPFIHLLALTLPRNYENVSNGYISPFLVRAYFRGIMNIDLGIITSLSVTRGGEGNWSLDNLPTSIDVSLSIKDLYKSMYIADGDVIGAKFLGNDGEIDYLMNLAGINVSQPSIKRRVALQAAITTGNIATFIPRMGTKLMTDYINLMDKIYGKFGAL